MHSININISNKSILVDMKEILLKRYFLFREFDNLILTRIDLLVNIINTIIHLIEISKR